MNLGIELGNRKLSILLYADDIALVANSPEDLQTMLNKLHEWCKRWRVLINTNKSKCLHFRKNRTKETSFNFTIGSNKLEKVDNYKYLGVKLTHTGNFTLNAENLGKAGGRALGKIISTIHNNKDFRFNAYEKLFYSCVIPVLDYASSIWGFKKFQSIDNIQNRAIRYFMGVHRFAPTLAIYGDTGWIPSQFRRWINMIRFWNRVLSFDEERITKIVFEFDYNRCRNNWCCDLKEVFHILELDNYFESKLMVDIDLVQSKIHTYYSNYWSNEILNISKLRTFVIFKTVFGRENYLFLDMPKYLRSTLAQFRCGIIPIRIETGRFQGEPIEERICVFCSNRSVEDEFHFLLYCSLYNDYRKKLFENIGLNQSEEISDDELLRLLIVNYPRQVAKHLYSSIKRRQSIVFK